MSILIKDVEFLVDMILELLENFDNDFPDCLNSFNEGELLECLSSVLRICQQDSTKVFVWMQKK